MSPSFSTPGNRPQRRFLLLPEQAEQEGGRRPTIRRYRLASIARDAGAAALPGDPPGERSRRGKS